MYRIIPSTELIFKLVNNNVPKPKSYAYILFSILTIVGCGYVIVFLLILALCLIIGIEHAQKFMDVFYAFVFAIQTIVNIYYVFRKYTISVELYRFANLNFDLKLIDVSDDPNSKMSGYMIDYLCIETPIFDTHTVYIKNKKPTNYGVLRRQILKKYNKNKSPSIPFGSEEYSNYMHILTHTLNDSPDSLLTFRELYVRAKLERD